MGARGHTDARDRARDGHNRTVSSRLGAEAIETAATRLFATRGVDAVTVADIVRASGHRNRSAVSYHFGSKDDLVRALITDIVDDHDRVRIERLDRLDERDEPATLHEVLDAAIAPMVDDLAAPGTRLRLRMLANLATDDHHMGFIQDIMVDRPGLARSTAAILERMGDLPDDIRAERVVLATTFGLRAFADQARLVDSEAPDRPPLETAVFTAHTVDLLQALLTASYTPPS